MNEKDEAVARASCKCTTSGNVVEPLWSLCILDRFCPWCGGQIRGLVSKNFSEDDESRKLILYVPIGEDRSGPLEFRATAKLYFHNTHHQWAESNTLPVEALSLNLTSGASRLQFRGHIDGDEIIMRTSEGIRFETSDIPDRGIDGILALQGDFPDEEWAVLLCKPPTLVCSLHGRGVRPVIDQFPKNGQSRWEITDFSLLRLVLNVSMEHAPVYVANRAREANEDDERVPRSPVRCEVKVRHTPGGEIKQNHEFKEQQAVQGKTPFIHLDHPLRPGQLLLPSTRNVNRSEAISLQLNCKELQPLWQVEIQIELDRSGEPQSELATLTHTLICDCVDLGKIRIDPPQISLPVMYEGEYRSNATAQPLTNPEGAAGAEVQKILRLKPVIDPVEVSNGGSNEVELRPAVEGGGEWIRVGWDVSPLMLSQQVDRKDPSKLTLKPGESCRLLIELDFRDTIALNPPLKARVVLYEATTGASKTVELGDLTILIQRIEKRVPGDSPLFIDFGNSNTTATVFVNNPGGRPSVRPGHDYSNEEHFPTVLLFKRLDAIDNYLASETVIGPFATDEDEATRGPDNASRLVTALKLRLCRQTDDELPNEIPCVDLSNIHAWLTATDLLTHFLREIIRRAETLLRGKSITTLVMSYPARLSPKQRRDYFKAFQIACKSITESGGRNSVTLELRDDIKVDEANAVALGFAYSSDKETTEKIDQCLKRNKNCMRVAAIDLGGGSLDIACIEFFNQSTIPKVRRWKSKYLWIGGDAQFGGNNLTAASFELLRLRLVQHFSEVISQPEPTEGSVRVRSKSAELLVRLQEIPSPDDFFLGRAADKAARFLALWDAAEAVKLSALNHDSGVDWLRFTRLIAATLRVPPEEIANLPQTLAQIDLTQIENHRIQRDQHGQQEYTVAERLNRAIDELSRMMQDRNVTIDFVVIGGGASPWPLLQRDLEVAFSSSQTTIIYDPLKLKSRVAEGLALAWPALNVRGGNHPACSGDYTTADLALIEPYTYTPQRIVSICTPFRDEKFADGWRPLQLLDQPDAQSADILREFRSPLDADIDAAWKLDVCRYFSEDNWEILGSFFAGGSSQPPPPPSTEWTSVDFRFLKDEDELEIRIKTTDSEIAEHTIQMTKKE